MKKSILNEAVLPSLADFVPVRKNENFESNSTNIQKAKENARRIISQYNKNPSFKKQFVQALSNGEMDTNAALTVSILSYISGIKNPTNIKREKANLGKTKISSNSQADAQELLSKLYDIDFEKISENGIDEKIISKADKIISTKYESNTEETPEEEADSEEQPEEQPEEEVPEEETPDEKDTEKITPKTEKQPESTKETPDNKLQSVINKIGDKKPSEIVTDLKARFEEESKKAVELVKKRGYNERAVAKVIESLRSKFTKNVNAMLKQEDAFTGDYGFNTKSRAAQAINVSLNNANYIIDSIANKSFLKSSPTTIALMGKEAAQELSKVGQAIKSKATSFIKSKPMQDISGEINKTYQAAKGATAKTLDKISQKIISKDEEKKAKAAEASSPEGKERIAQEQKAKDEQKAKKQAESQAKIDAIKSKISGVAQKVAQKAKEAGSTVASGVKKAAESMAAKKTPKESPDIESVNAGLAKKNAEQLSQAQKPVLAGQIDKTKATDVGNKAPVVQQQTLPATIQKPQVPTVQTPPKPGEPNYGAWLRQQRLKNQASAAKNLEQDEYTGRHNMANNACSNVDAIKKRIKKY